MYSWENALDVSGNTLISGDLNVTGFLNTGNMSVSELDVNQITYSSTPLNVSRNTIVNGNLDVTGILNAGSTHLTPMYSWENALDVSGNTLISGDLNVTGFLNTENLDVNQITYSATPLNVSRNTIVNGNLDVTGILNAGSTHLTPMYSWENALDVSGNTLISGNLDVTGFTHLKPTYSLDNALDVSGNTLVSGNLDVTGILTAGIIDVSSMELTSLDVSGTTNLRPTYTWENALDVSGNTLISGNLDVTGDLKVSQTTFNTVSSQARNITFNDVSGTVMVTGFSSINSSTTLNASHNGVILASGTISLTLPDPTTVLGTTYTIKKTDSSANNVTIIGLVDNVNNPELLEQYSYITIVSDGSAWYKVAEFVAVPEVENPATIRNSLGMTFQLIPAGTFVMGSPIDELGRGTDESQYTVTLTESFYMQTTEVTQGQWEMLMNDNPSNFIDCGLNCPVEYISWEEAETFIINLNAMGEGSYTFPTEAQWEYAARSGSNKAFANGDISNVSTDSNLDAMGWYSSNANSIPHAVAQKQANAWGLFDMHGNVSEWCNDWSDTYPTGSVTDPGGPSSGSSRVFRGGSYGSFANYCRSAHRGSYSPGGRIANIGLRLSRTLKP
jgi:formylglycine-generating enzyme required for sulfatase activity